MQQVFTFLNTSTSLEKLATHADRIMVCYPSGATYSSFQQTSVSTSRSVTVVTFAHEGNLKPDRDPSYVDLPIDGLHHYQAFRRCQIVCAVVTLKTSRTQYVSYPRNSASCVLPLTTFTQPDVKHIDINGPN
uniref:Uncharacterized protein n=1 Tax=Schistocephalus solidus TaxID=70667 RepID=A0A0V0J451_SCHSO